jgi:dUTP pyrophosphatase
MIVEFKKERDGVVLPERGSEFAGGWDVRAMDIEYKSKDFVICRIGFSAALPERYKLTLVPRSSLTNTRWVVINSPGLGDPDFRGEYQFRFRAIPSGVKIDGIAGPMLTYDDFPYNLGDRIGQIYVEEIIPVEFKEVDSLSETKRGTGGFGHTGVR